MSVEKNKNWINRLLSHTLTALLAATATAFVLISWTNANQKPVTKLDALEQLILDRFIGEADQTLMEDAAADAMIGALGDRWSYYISAAEYEDYLEQKANAYVGIGVTVIQRQDGTGLDVDAITAGGGAEEAGLLAGDVITGLDGQSIAGMDMDVIRTMIRGQENTSLEITVLREGQEHTFTVLRKQIQTPVATGKMLDGGIGLVRIANFNNNCSTETIAAIEELLEQGAEKLIFDVRYNGGGYASELKTVLDYLLPEGRLYRMVDYQGNESIETSDAKSLQIPMAVLVNGSSHSAAELFAAALREYDAAVLVGEKTSGKGHYQVVYSLPDGSAVGLSIGKYFTPKDNCLEGVGLTPDRVVPVDEKTAAAIYAGTLSPEDDYQIQAAIAALNEG